MRKFAMTTIAAATLLVGGLTGCGVDNQAGDMGGGAFRGAGAGTGHAPTTEHRGMTGARYTGEGPITDMFTRDDRTGRTGVTGYGVEQRRGTPIQGGQLGVQNRNGIGLDNRGMDRANQRGTGIFGQDAGQRGTGIFGQDRGQRGTDTGLFGQDNGQRGTGLFGQGGIRGNEFGARGGAGFTGQMGERGMTGTAGMRGHRDGMTGATGITGNRPGMVDDQGVLRGQRAGQRGLGAQDGRMNRGLTGAKTAQNASVQNIQHIVDRATNGADSHVVVHGDSVMIGIEATGQDANTMKNKIKQQVEREVQGLDVHVITDREQVKQLRTMDQDGRNGRDGGLMEETGATITEMTRDVGRAVQRPFERTR